MSRFRRAKKPTWSTQPSPGHEGAVLLREPLPSWSVPADGIRIVFGSRMLLTLLLFGWLAGFYIVLQGLAAPYRAFAARPAR